jgi:PAS domain S-box-containing protein
MTQQAAHIGLTAGAEIAALIDQLQSADSRLEELLGSQVDSVMDRHSRPILLRRAQGELHQHEIVRQAAILNALPANIALLDARGRVVSINAAWREFAQANGLGGDGCGVGQDYLAVCDAAMGDDAVQAHAVATGLRGVLDSTLADFSCEYACHSPDEQRWFKMRVSPLATYAYSGAVVMHTNITESRQAAEALTTQTHQTARREAMLTRMLSAISDFTYILDREGRVGFANQTLLTLWGFSLEQVVGKTFRELGYPEAQATMLQAQIDEVFAKRSVVVGDLVYESPTGKSGHYEYIFAPALAEDGTVDFVVGSTRDITQRVLDQHNLSLLNAQLTRQVGTGTAALKRQEALFETLAEQAPAVIWTLDASCTVLTYMNRAGIELLGSSMCPDGQRRLPPVHPEDVQATNLEVARAQATCTSFQTVRRLRAVEGQYRIMSCRASPVFSESGALDFWVGVDMDITELKEVESALRKSNSELESFSYAVAHDLRSPLGIIAGFSRLLEKDLGAGASARQLHLLARITSGVRQMDAVSQGLLALAGLVRNPFLPEATDLSQMAQDIAALLSERDPERKVQWHIQEGVSTLCDRRMMQSLLGNLMGNAWKFSTNAPLATISFSAHAGADADGLTSFSVQDNGAGFDMAYADKLFVPFQRLHTADEFEGTGIGLATVAKIVERHGGTISARGEPGRGATFEFTLQAKPVATFTYQTQYPL